MIIRLLILSIILSAGVNARGQSPVVWAKYYKGEHGAYIYDIQTGFDSTYFFVGSQYVYANKEMHTEAWYAKISQQGEILSEGLWSEGDYYTIGKSVKVLAPDYYAIIGSGGSYGNNSLMYVTVNLKEKKVKKTVYQRLKIVNYCKGFESARGNLLVIHDVSENGSFTRLTRYSNKSAQAVDTVSFRFADNVWINDLHEKDNGNIILVGGTPVSGDYVRTQNLLMEVDKNLQEVWKIERAKASFDNIFVLCPIANENYIISGFRQHIGSSLDRKVVWHAQIDPKGNTIWERELPQFVTSSPHNQLVPYKEGYYAFAGQHKNNDVYVMVFDQKGEPVWEYTYVTKGEETVNALTVGENGDLIVAGEYFSGTNREAFVYCFNPQQTQKAGPKSVLIHVRDFGDRLPLPATVKVKFEDGSIKEFKDTSFLSITIPQNESCIVQVEALGYSPKEIPITPEEFRPELFVYIERVKAGSSIVMNNVQFERGTTTLIGDSYAELDNLVKFMNDHSDIKIELSGHTDNGGLPKANQTLSEQRAATVKDYLVSKGIAANRITGKGYGGKKPIAPNNTEENKSKNRRVEVKIL